MEAKPTRIKKPRGVAQLLDGKCIACGARCQSVCPTDAIEMNDRGEADHRCREMHRLSKMHPGVSR